MSDDELVIQARAISEQIALEIPRGEFAGNEPNLSADYQSLRRALAALRFEAHERGISAELGLVRDEPAETISIQIPGLDIGLAATDPAILREQLEALIAELGMDGAEDVLLPLLAYEIPGGTNEESSAILTAKSAVLRQLGFLRVENDEFIDHFASAGKVVGLGLLAQSRMHVRTTMAQYGIKKEDAPTNMASFVEGPYGNKEPTANTKEAKAGELGEMLRFAKRLVSLHKQIETSLNQRYAQAENPGQKDWGEFSKGDGNAKFTELVEEFTRVRNQALEKHPALEDFMTGRGEPSDAMESLSGKSVAGAAKTMGAEFVGHLVSIEQAQRGIESGKLPIWKNPKIIELTKAHTGVVPGSMRDGLVQEKVSDETERGWTDTLVAVVSLGAAILTSFLPGGQAIAAELAMVAVDLALMSGEIDAYQLQKASTNTDFAAARKLAEGEPSLFPVVVSMVGAGMGIVGVRSAIAKVRKLRTTVLAAGGIDASEVRALRAELNKLGAAHGKADLGDEVAQSAIRSGDDISRLARMNAGAQSGRVAEQGTETFSRRLGVSVEFDKGLGNGARVDYVVDGTGRVNVTRLRVGPEALADTVLAHRKVIARMERYNGVVGSLRSLWDRMRDGVTRRMRGTVRRNPFPAGTRGWESWEELAKIDDLIKLRQTRWQGKLSAKALDHDIEYLEAERAFHRSVVDAIEADELAFKKGVGFVEAPKTGEITAQAKEAGYLLPEKYKEYYYYRRVKGPDGEVIRYQLAIKSNAPKALDIPSLQPKMVNGVPVKGEFVESIRARVVEHIGASESVADVTARFLGDESNSSLKPLAAMLEREGLAKKGEVASVIATLRKGTFAGVADVDKLRHAVKEKFRERVHKHLLDDSLDEAPLNVSVIFTLIKD